MIYSDLNSEFKTNFLFPISQFQDKKIMRDLLDIKEVIKEFNDLYNLDSDSIHNIVENKNKSHKLILDSKKIPNNFLKSLNFLKTISTEFKLDHETGICIKEDCIAGLQRLKASFESKVDCIYIDPPYNTGSKEFQYNDNYDSEEWKKLLESSLKMAYLLLDENGVIFISIDDNELVQLRLLCDSIFDRFIGMFTWHKKTQPSFLTKEFISVTEYILCYKKGKGQLNLKGGYTNPTKHTELLNISNELTERILKKNNLLIYNSRKFFSGTLEKGVYGNEKLKVTLKNDVTIKNGIPNNDLIVEGRFRWSQEKIDKMIDENRKITIKSIHTLRSTVSGSGKKKIKAPISILSKKINNMPTNTDANKEMKNLFKIPPFYYPKPTKLIKYLIDSVTYNNPSAIILDFFAGSGTTGQAVLELNYEHQTNRKFILIEPGDHFNTILIPRLKKILTSRNWKKGSPVSLDVKADIIKYFD